MITVSFTASRFSFAPPPGHVAETLALLPLTGARYVTGACEGGDAWIGAFLYFNRPEAEHEVIVPWDHRQIDPWWTRAGRLPLITVTQMPAGTTYKDRNQALANRADEVIGFPLFPERDPRSRRSGTWQTIRMARRARKLAFWQCVAPPYGKGTS